MEKRSSNLAYIMSVFNISNLELSERLNVHFSLVSKWKSNKRKLSAKGEHLRRIIDIFIQLDKPSNFQKLQAILSEQFRGAKLDSEKAISETLEKWLTMQNSSIAELNVHTNKISSHAIIDIYQGHDRKNDCISRLIDYAISLPPGQKLCIWHNQRIHSILSDQQCDFILAQAAKYREFLGKNGSINVIHSLNKTHQEIFYSILESLPLSTTGKVLEYCDHNYSDMEIKYSIYLLEDTACSLSTEFADNKNTNTSYFASNPIVVSSVKQIYDNIHKSVLPLYNREFVANPRMFRNAMNDTLSRDGIAYMLTSEFVPIFTMSKELFETLLDYNGLDNDEKERHLALHSATNRAFLQSIQKQSFRIIMIPPKNDWIKNGESFYINYTDKPLRIESELYLEHIRQLDSLAKQNEFLSIYITSELNLPPCEGANIVTKENSAILVMSTQSSHNIPIMVQDQIVVGAFFSCLDKLWNTIPPTREHTDLIEAFGIAD